MKDQFHILNGDSLKDRFPTSIPGNKYVARECLVDGDVKAKDINALYELRARFISENYKDFSKADYFSKSVSEFEKIRAIPTTSEINLWFEDDLFCQVNFWFIVYLLSNSHSSLFLVRPLRHNQFGFGGLNPSELQEIYSNRILITEKNKIACLWSYYQNANNAGLISISNELKEIYPYILDAVLAHIEREPTKDQKGRPTESLLQIMKDLNTTDFNPVFKEFNKREPIYGFGDVQIKRLFDKIINTK